ncbi:MAG: energy transducer TonB [Cephaloticoccus sp.]|nr:energy transducer TonB [Cephaloticoccus sp.]
MKIRFYSLFLCLASLAFAQAPHPTVLTTKYKDQMLPVIKVLGTDPVVLVEGTEKRIRIEPTYMLERAPGYSRISADVLGQTMSTRETRMVDTESAAAAASDAAQSMGGRFGISHFDLSVRAHEAVRGGFVVAVIYSEAAMAEGGRFTAPEIVVHDLPDLPAGQSTVVKFSSAIPDGADKLRFFVQLFDADGREMMTDKSPDSWKFYAYMERMRLRDALPHYVAKFAGADHAAAPIIMPRPIMSPGWELPGEPVEALLTISAEGVVTDLRLSRVPDDNLRRALTESLQGWLFFPKLRAGTPVESKVQVPIKF